MLSLEFTRLEMIFHSPNPNSLIGFISVLAMLIERPEHLLEKSLIGKRFSLIENQRISGLNLGILCWSGKLLGRPGTKYRINGRMMTM